MFRAATSSDFCSSALTSASVTLTMPLQLLAESVALLDVFKTAMLRRLLMNLETCD